MEPLIDVVPADGSPYPVLLGADLTGGLREIWHPEWRRVAIVGDETTMDLFGDEVERGIVRATNEDAEIHRLRFEGGEHHKTRATKAKLEDTLLSAGLDRRSVIVAVGGGLVLDVAGFVAATFMRGIAHVNVATTLLAQIDAAIGGKTGVNTPHGKNLVGAFHHPRAVLLHTGALVHLPHDERRNGLAEAIKHCVIRDANLFGAMDRWAAADDGTLLPPDAIVGRCVAIKAAVVAEDGLDRGVRQILNFGHTVAHAIEAATEHAVPHGQAVAMGMVVEARLAAQQHTFPHTDVTRLVALLTRLGLPTHPACPFAAAAPFLARDKKNLDGAILCALPQRIGAYEAVDGQWTREVSPEALARAWGDG